MAHEEIRFGKDRIEGVVDVGIVVLSHFENPAKDTALVIGRSEVEEEMHNSNISSLGSISYSDKILES